MRNIRTRTRCIRVNSQKSKSVCRCYSDLQLRYLEKLDKDEKIKEVRLNVRLQDLDIEGTYSTDFVITLKDKTTMISSTFHSVYSIGISLELEGFSIINNIIWRKTNPAPNLACRCFTHSTETIIWARKILSNNKKGKHTFNYREMKISNGGKQMKDVWNFNDEPIWYESACINKKEKTEGNHPTQKPIALLERIITAATNEGDIVLDPFSGSGTTGIASAKLNRKYIGIEIDDEYLFISKNRHIILKESNKTK